MRYLCACKRQSTVLVTAITAQQLYQGPPRVPPAMKPRISAGCWSKCLFKSEMNVVVGTQWSHKFRGRSQHAGSTQASHSSSRLRGHRQTITQPEEIVDRVADVVRGVRGASGGVRKTNYAKLSGEFRSSDRMLSLTTSRGSSAVFNSFAITTKLAGFEVFNVSNAVRKCNNKVSQREWKHCSPSEQQSPNGEPHDLPVFPECSGTDLRFIIPWLSIRSRKP